MKDALSRDQWFIDLWFRLSELTILFLLEYNFRIVCQFSAPSSFWPGLGVVSCVSYGGCGHQDYSRGILITGRMRQIQIIRNN